MYHYLNDSILFYLCTNSSIEFVLPYHTYEALTARQTSLSLSLSLSQI